MFSIEPKPVSPQLTQLTVAVARCGFLKAAVAVVASTDVHFTDSVVGVFQSITETTPTPMLRIEAGETVCTPAAVIAVPSVVGGGALTL
jgi:hypothetical protein